MTNKQKYQETNEKNAKKKTLKIKICKLTAFEFQLKNLQKKTFFSC